VIVAVLNLSWTVSAMSLGPNASVARLQVNPTDVSFMMFAARAVHSESAIAELAATRSQNPDLKAVADKVKANHDKIADELKTLAASRNVKLPTDLEPDQKSAAAKLAKLSTAAFDKAFLEYLVTDHQELLQRFTKSQRTTPDGDVRTFAEKALQTLRETLQQAMNVKAMIR
jgi:putative membrane protein